MKVFVVAVVLAGLVFTAAAGATTGVAGYAIPAWQAKIIRTSMAPMECAYISNSAHRKYACMGSGFFVEVTRPTSCRLHAEMWKVSTTTLVKQFNTNLC